jgi:hypothetical protein
MLLHDFTTPDRANRVGIWKKDWIILAGREQELKRGLEIESWQAGE